MRNVEFGMRNERANVDSAFDIPHSALGTMFDFTLDATSGPARAGTLTLPHGTVETPVFMPVGTQGTVRALSPDDLRAAGATLVRSEEHTSELQSPCNLVCRLLLEKKKKKT